MDLKGQENNTSRGCSMWHILSNFKISTSDQ